MAACDQGYLCDVCGDAVPNLTVSDLYLRYVIGEISSRELLAAPERHIRCNPTLAQFIVDSKFEPIRVEGAFDKEFLDSVYVQEREMLVTAGWRRLQELPSLSLPISDYPLKKSDRS